jgi:hypothetical protein
LREINLSEIISRTWRDENSDVVKNIAAFNKVPRLTFYLLEKNKTNKVQTSCWITQAILVPGLSIRVRRIEYFIKVLDTLGELVNLHDGAMVFSVLRSASISRLKKTWSQVRLKSTFRKLNS